MSVYEDAVLTLGRREFGSAHTAWTEIRRTNKINGLADIILIYLSARIGEIDDYNFWAQQYTSVREESPELDAALKTCAVLRDRRDRIGDTQVVDWEDVQSARELGRKLLEARYLAESEKAWQELHQRAPKELEPLKRLAQIEEWRGNWEAAYRLASLGLEIRDDEELRVVLSNAEKMIERPVEGLEAAFRRFLNHPLVTFAKTMQSEGRRGWDFATADIAILEREVFGREASGEGEEPGASEDLPSAPESLHPIGPLHDELQRISPARLPDWVADQAVLAVRLGRWEIAGEIVDMMGRSFPDASREASGETSV